MEENKSDTEIAEEDDHKNSDDNENSIVAQNKINVTNQKVIIACLT